MCDRCDIPTSERRSDLVWTLRHIGTRLSLPDSPPGKIGQATSQALDVLAVDGFDGSNEIRWDGADATQGTGKGARHGSNGVGVVADVGTANDSFQRVATGSDEDAD